MTIIKAIINDLKENKLLKIYLILFSLINVIYLFFSGTKSNYIDKNELGGTIEKFQFEYLSRISKITNFLEILILLMVLGYLIKILTKKAKGKYIIQHFLITHFMLLVVLFSTNYLVSVFSPAYFWPSSQLLFLPVQINIVVLIYFLITTLYKKIYRSFKTLKQ